MAQTKINASQTTITAEDIGASSSVATMPTAAVGYLDKIVQYVGATDATYTNGYFYKCVSDGDPTPTYSWTAVQVQASSGGLPSQTGNSGKFLTTDGTDASWSDKVLTNLANTNAANSLAIGGYTYQHDYSVLVGISAIARGWYAVIIGYGASVENSDGVAIGYQAVASTASVAIGYQAKTQPGVHSDNYAIALGKQAVAQSRYTIQIGKGTNSTEGTFSVGLENGNYRMLDTNGTIPADRFASTSGLADGNYRLRLTMSNGTPTLSWVAE